MPRPGLRAGMFVGLAAGVAGFLWGALLAGVPYQDATPEQAARFAFHAQGSLWLMGLGVAVFLVSAGCKVSRWYTRRGAVGHHPHGGAAQPAPTPTPGGGQPGKGGLS